MANKNFTVKNGLEVGGQEVITSSGAITSAALGGQVLGTSASPSFANITTAGYLRGPATFVIDPAAHGDDTGTVVIAGNLQVDGTQTTINSTTMTVDDLNLTLASGAANAAAANGAGITVDITGATNPSLVYGSSNDDWTFNKNLNVTGNIGVTGTVDGVDIAARDAILTSTTTTASAALPLAGGTMTGSLVLGNASGIYSHELKFTNGSYQAGIDYQNNGNLRFIDRSSNRVGAYISTLNGNFAGYNTSNALTNLLNTNGDSYLNGGNVGIGTDAPTQKLEVAMTRTSSTSGIVLQLSDNVTGAQTDGVYKAIRSASNAGNSISEIRFLETDGTNNNTSISFATAAAAGGLTERVRINQLGNVGIGTTSPSANLEIKPTGADGSFKVTSDANSGNNVVISQGYNTYITASNNLYMGVGGTADNLSIVSGKVGIGNLAPLARLTIGSSQGNSLEFSYDTSNGYRNNISNYWNSGADTRMDFNIGRAANVAPVTVMSVGYNNNVGIGTTSPVVSLQVNGTNASIGVLGTPKADWYTTAYNGLQVADGLTLWGRAGDAHMSGNYYVKDVSGVAKDSYINTGYAHDLWFDNGSGDLKYRNAASGSANAEISSFPTRLVIKNNGNVGIGTTAPSGKLEVAGGSTGLVISNLGDASAYDRVELQYSGYNSGTPVFKFRPTQTPGSGIVNSYFRFMNSNGTSTSANNYANVTIDGNVGIGETVPQTKLHVKSGDSGGTVYNAGYNPIVIETPSHGGIQILTPNNRNGLIYFGDNDNAVSGRIEYEHTNDSMHFVTAGTERMRISSGGIVTKPYQPAFSAYANTNETTAAGATAPFDALIFDQGGNYSTANRRFVAPVAGIYQFSTYTNANGISTGNSMWCVFAVNGTYRGAYMYLTVPTGANWVLIGGTQTIKLVANDYVEVKAGVAMHWDYGNPAWSNFSGHLVG